MRCSFPISLHKVDVECVPLPQHIQLQSRKHTIAKTGLTPISSILLNDYQDYPCSQEQIQVVIFICNWQYRRKSYPFSVASALAMWRFYKCRDLELLSPSDNATAIHVAEIHHDYVFEQPTDDFSSVWQFKSIKAGKDCRRATEIAGYSGVAVQIWITNKVLDSRIVCDPMLEDISMIQKVQDPDQQAPSAMHTIRLERAPLHASLYQKKPGVAVKCSSSFQYQNYKIKSFTGTSRPPPLNVLTVASVSTDLEFKIFTARSCNHFMAILHHHCRENGMDWIECL